MQTFLISLSFIDTAASLDYRRLGKQRVEAMQLISTIELNGSWRSHPAAKMWDGYVPLLAYYGSCMCDEWLMRGYNDNIKDFFLQRIESNAKQPFWYSDINHSVRLVTSHRARLYIKNPEYYTDFKQDAEYVDSHRAAVICCDRCNYYWPTHGNQ